MSAYAIGLLEDLQFGPDIVTYLQRIDATLAPFGGEFLVHGTRPELKEGKFGGDCVVIAFPSMEQARAWYDSDAYAPMIPMRTQHSRSTVFLLEGVKEVPYRAVGLLQKLGV
ncbi:DUF1330 domain-containing protein [Acidovorax sp. Root217]|uniref:DUF1330 domain-containing protein n=1 Tax=Acidovorax sp. Root217 TaxID=1736492 RepID=UPI0007090D3D|nr:DUF1330 domain-containing protein [Acidovorax sp. Root217]KRC26066.1 hypothetical protein ASE31_18480 [Acidovorax sp. Root217]